MFRTMQNAIFSASVYFALLGSALAFQTGICPTHAAGRWAVVSYQLDPVSAVSDKEARQNVGKTAIISDARAVFASSSCTVSRAVVETSDEEPGYPYAVTYFCGGNKRLPTFFVGKSCDTILAALDGATYILKRK
jgi:hypothetical protein